MTLDHEAVPDHPLYDDARLDTYLTPPSPASRYAASPDQPPSNVSRSAFDIARAVLMDAATWKDVNPEEAIPIADTVILGLDQVGFLRAPNALGPAASSVRAVLDQIPDGLPVNVDLTLRSGEVIGTITVPHDTPEETVRTIRERVSTNITVISQRRRFGLGAHPRQRFL